MFVVLNNNIKCTACNFKADKKYLNNCIPTFGTPCIMTIFSVANDLSCKASIQTIESAVKQTYKILIRSGYTGSTHPLQIQGHE